MHLEQIRFLMEKFRVTYNNGAVTLYAYSGDSEWMVMTWTDSSPLDI